ncbi:MAG: molybdenum cofactor guanylyltransferase [Anaerolineales bacterium]
MGSEIFIVSNHPEDYHQFGFPVYTDIIKGVGALGGIHTVLSHINTEKVLILACDMPFVNSEITKYLLSLAIGFDVVIPKIHPKGFVEPFKAVYSKSCLKAVEKAIMAKKRRVISFFDDVNVKYVEKEEIAPMDPDFISFLNVNTPEDLRTALKIAEERT